MYLNNRKIKSLLALIIVFSLFSGGLAFSLKSKDLAPNDELSLGSSVFIFRGSTKKRQFKSTSTRYIKRSYTSRKLTKPRRVSKTAVASRRKTSVKRKTETVSNKPKTVENISMTVEELFDLAVDSYNRGRYEDSIANYKKVIALDAAHPDAHANLASAYRQLERYAEANAEYKSAAEFINDDTDLFSEWGYCLGKVEEWTKAVARLQTATDLEKDAINYANVGWAYLNAAQKDITDKNTAQARTNFLQAQNFLQKSLALNPALTAVLLNLGIVYNGLGEPQNAAAILIRANSARKNWVPAINELGNSYRQSNSFPAAILQFQKAVRLNDKYAVGYFNLGEAQFSSGKKDDARKTLEKLKTLDKVLASRLDKIIN